MARGRTRNRRMASREKHGKPQRSVARKLMLADDAPPTDARPLPAISLSFHIRWGVKHLPVQIISVRSWPDNTAGCKTKTRMHLSHPALRHQAACACHRLSSACHLALSNQHWRIMFESCNSCPILPLVSCRLFSSPPLLSLPPSH